MNTQTITVIEVADLLKRVEALKNDGNRLSQISCTRTQTTFELSYSFDKDFTYTVLRIVLPDNNVEIPSISSIYLAAFTYENELHDLFGIKIKGIAVDFQGNFYKVREKFAFAKPAENAAAKQKENA
jgi:ech hydrogenase subunit D